MAVELLSAEFESALVVDTVAVLLSEPAADGVTTIVIVALAPFASVPRLQLTVAVPEHDPTDDDDDTNDTPAGSGSLTVTAAAEFGPAFCTCSVYVRLLPTTTGSGESPFVMERSADVVTKPKPNAFGRPCSTPPFAGTEVQMAAKPEFGQSSSPIEYTSAPTALSALRIPVSLPAAP
jgi:hypothetical protein